MQAILKTNPWSGQKCPKGGVRSMQPTRKSCLCILPASRSRNRILVRRSTLERDIFVSDVEGGGYVEKPITQLRVAFTIIAASTTLSNRLEGSPSCWFAAHIDSKGFFFACYPLPLPPLSSNRRPPRLFLSLLLERYTSSLSSLG